MDFKTILQLYHNSCSGTGADLLSFLSSRFSLLLPMKFARIQGDLEIIFIPRLLLGCVHFKKYRSKKYQYSLSNTGSEYALLLCAIPLKTATGSGCSQKRKFQYRMLLPESRNGQVVKRDFEVWVRLD